MQLFVKSSTSYGCTFLGKGIVGHPEMGVVCECREVIFDEWDHVGHHWTGRNEVVKVMLRTDTGYSFDNDMLRDGVFEIENYAPNWRAHKKDAWGVL